MFINFTAIIFHWIWCILNQHYSLILFCDLFCFYILHIWYLITINLRTGVRIWRCLDSFSTIQGITRRLDNISKIFSTTWQPRMASSSMEYEAWWGTFFRIFLRTFRGTELCNNCCNNNIFCYQDTFIVATNWIYMYTYVCTCV